MVDMESSIDNAYSYRWDIYGISSIVVMALVLYMRATIIKGCSKDYFEFNFEDDVHIRTS